MLVAINLLFNVVLSVIVWNKTLDLPDTPFDMICLITFWMCLNLLTANRFFQVRK